MTTVIVIATYNEAATIGAIVDALREYRVVVVDDNSPDGTAEIVKRYPNVRLLVRPGKQGIMTAYRFGLNFALGLYPEYIVQMDAGGTHDPTEVRNLLAYARASRADLVIGSRFLRRQYRGTRTLISWGAAWLMRRVGIQVHDATSGFRVWRADLLQRLDLDSLQAHGFAFQLETLYMAHKAGAVIVEWPISYRLTNSSFNWRMVREALGIWAGMARREIHTRVPHL